MNTEDLSEQRGGNILVVDDMPENLRVLCTMLKQQGYRARPIPGGKLALQAVATEPPDLILLDITMPDMNGYEVCIRLKADEATRRIPVIFISALTELDDKIKAFAAGGLDYITKPFQFEEVQARVNTHLKLNRLQRELERYSSELERLVQEQVLEISQSQMSTIEVLAQLTESRDECTGGHIRRIQVMSRMLAEQLRSFPHHSKTVTDAFLECIFHASALHDIGKVAISDAILLKPGRLTPEEMAEMKKHTTYAAQTLRAAREKYPRNSFLNMGIAIARSHHERWDGGGYPDGLGGEDIPFSARIMAVVDVYDALRSKRPYKEGMPHDKAREIILKDSGAHFDPECVSAFDAASAAFEKAWHEMEGA
jgi:putative two-component system response regulator